MGFEPEHFWHLTPREISLHIEASVRRTRRAQDERAWLAWHVAALQRVKKLPPLKSMLAAAPRQPQSLEDQMAIAQQWIARTGMLTNEE